MEVFDIRVLGFEAGAGDPVGELARVFGIDTRTAEKIVRRAPVVVKRNVDEHTAERFFNHLRSIGAQVRLEKRVVPSMRPPAASSPPSGAGPAPMEPILAPPDPSFLTPHASSPPAAFELAAEDPLTIESLPVPDFDAVGLDTARYDSARPPSMAPAAAPTDPPVTPKEDEGDELRPLLPRLLGAFSYPFQKSAPAIFLGVVLVATLASIIPIVGFFLWLGVQAIFFFRVIQDSGEGEDELPRGGEFVDLFDLLVPSFRFFVALAVPFVPAILGAYVIGANSPAVIPITGLLLLLGLAYMPASVMVASLTGGCLGPLNPVAGVLIMTRVPGPYILTTLAVGVVMIIHSATMAGVFMVTKPILIPFLPGLIRSCVALILPTIACRMLGIFLHQYRHELGLGLG